MTNLHAHCFTICVPWLRRMPLHYYTGATTLLHRCHYSLTCVMPVGTPAGWCDNHHINPPPTKHPTSRASAPYVTTTIQIYMYTWKYIIYIYIYSQVRPRVNGHINPPHEQQSILLHRLALRMRLQPHALGSRALFASQEYAAKSRKVAPENCRVEIAHLSTWSACEGCQGVGIQVVLRSAAVLLGATHIWARSAEAHCESWVSWDDSGMGRCKPSRGKTSQKVSSTLTVHDQFSSELTFENFYPHPHPRLHS